MSKVMLYWVTATAASSARLYWESFGWKRITARPVAVPTGVAVFLKEIITPMRKWMESRFTDVSTGATCPRAVTLARSSSPNFWSGTCGRSSGHFASREHELLRWSPGRSLVATKMREDRVKCARHNHP